MKKINNIIIIIKLMINRTSINVENENEYDDNCSVEYVN